MLGLIQVGVAIVGHTSAAALFSTLQISTEHERYLAASFTYQSAATEAALKRQYGAELQKYRQQIESGDVELKLARRQLAQGTGERSRLVARVATLEREIGNIKAQFLADLVARDASFAREQAVYESVANDILRSAEGQSAMEIYLAGGPQAYAVADGILARLQSERAKARAHQTLMIDIADARVRAVLAGDALAHGRTSVEIAIERNRDLLALAPSSAPDWLEIARLYWIAGASENVAQAARNALAHTSDPGGRAGAYFWSGMARMMAGDMAGAKLSFDDNLRLVRQIGQQQPDSIVARRNVIANLDRIGDLLMRMGNTDAAMPIFEEELSIARDNLNRRPELDGIQRDLLSPLFWTSSILTDRKDWPRAKERLDEARVISESLIRHDPGIILDQRNLFSTLARLGNLAFAQKDSETARSYYELAYQKSCEIVRMNEDDPESQNNNLTIQVTLAAMKSPGHRWRDVQRQIDAMRARGMTSRIDAKLLADVPVWAGAEAAAD